MKSIEQIKDARVYRTCGFSLNEISQKFEISKSTASLWTKEAVLNAYGKARVRSLAKSYQNKSAEISHKNKLKRLQIADIEAQTLLDNGINKLELAALAVMYWCEGSKDDRRVVFTNSDPNLVATFVNLFRLIFRIDESRLRIKVHIHDYHNEEEILQFWSKVTNIPLDQFNKSFLKESKHNIKRVGYKGCVHVCYSDARIARILLSFAKKFINLYI